VVVIAIAAAIITPTTDIVNLCLFAVPAIGLYFLGVGASFLAVRMRNERAAELAAEADSDE
jgi:sec-independent protein translocase protein TatC